MSDPRVLVDRLKAVAEGKVAVDVPLAPFTTYKIGGPSAVWVAPGSEKAVGEVLRVVHEAQVPLFVLGWGSNVLIADEGWPGVTLYLGENLKGVEFKGSEATALAGTWLLDLIQAAVDHGLSGMELMAGIPGGVGGALRMNAGAFGQEIESSTREVRGFDHAGGPVVFPRERIQFGYRKAPELEKVVITSATFGFSAEEAEVLKRRMAEILDLRAKKQPLEYPSCGSVFKRPVGYYAGALIEDSGFKGRRHGHAMVSDKHAGFILNTGNATAAEVHELILMIQEAVYKKFGVRLEREVKLIGFEEQGHAA